MLISLDTVRPDRLGCYGGDKTLTPHLDALAASSVRFTQACSTSSYTLPSHASMFTGQYPALHGAVDIDDRLDPARSPLLAQTLAEAGYVTAAFTGGGYVAPDFGFSIGFDRYSSNDPVWALDSVRGQQLLQTVSSERLPAQLPLLRRYAAPTINQWLAHQTDGVPFFAFLHTYIAHNYAPSHDWIVRRGLLDELQREVPFNHQHREAFNHPDQHPGVEVSREQVVQEYMPYYEATLGMADEFVGGVIEALRGAGLLDDTLVIVTSDHGEEFGEHGFFGHGETLYEPAVRVPLIVHLPRSVLAVPGSDAQQAPGAERPDGGSGSGLPPLNQPAVISGPVSLADLAPWILRLVGLPPDARMAQCGTAPDDVSPPRRGVLFMELDTRHSRLSAVREGKLKRITLIEGETYGLAVGQSRLFDLAADRGETKDLLGAAGAAARGATDVAPETAASADRLGKRLQLFHECVESLWPRQAAGEFDQLLLPPDLREQLQQGGDFGGARDP